MSLALDIILWCVAIIFMGITVVFAAVLFVLLLDIFDNE